MDFCFMKLQYLKYNCTALVKIMTKTIFDLQMKMFVQINLFLLYVHMYNIHWITQPASQLLVIIYDRAQIIHHYKYLFLLNQFKVFTNLENSNIIDLTDKENMLKDQSMVYACISFIFMY